MCIPRQLYGLETQLLLTNRAMNLCKCNGVADHLKHASPRMSYHAEFARYALKDVGIENPKIGKHWNSALLGRKAWLTPRYTLIPHIS